MNFDWFLFAWCLVRGRRVFESAAKCKGWRGSSSVPSLSRSVILDWLGAAFTTYWWYIIGHWGGDLLDVYEGYRITIMRWL